MVSEKPRGRIVNAESFEAAELAGKPVAQIVACRDPDEPPYSVEVVGVRLAGSKLWNRFFLDAGIGFWEECSPASAFFDFEDLERIDVLEQWSIARPRIVEVVCTGDHWALSSLTWRLTSGDLRLSYLDRDDSESPTVLKFAPIRG